MEVYPIKGGAVSGARPPLTRLPCHYCELEGVERLGIGVSQRCGVHYYKPALASAVGRER